MPDASSYITALRHSHQRLVSALQSLDLETLQGPSYDSDWNVAQVASHLGSQGEIFTAVVEAALAGAEPPGQDRFAEIWAVWDARTPREQADNAITSGDDFIALLEGLSDSDRQAFSVSMMGTDLDLAAVLGMLLAEHAVHTWDILVALDHTAEIDREAVGLLIDGLPATAARTGKPQSVEAADGFPSGGEVAVATTDPERGFRLRISPDVSLTPAGDSATLSAADADTVESGGLALPAAALIRLVYGRLDPHHTPVEIADDPRLDPLRAAFPGF